jgi:4-aminobutyrate aminotransferase-like enzyme
MTDVASNRNEVGARSKRIFEQEQRHMAPGLQSFALYSGLAMARGEGSRLYDEDGNAYRRSRRSSSV